MYGFRLFAIQGDTRIAFFDDRIEVENPGILLPSMTIEDMKQGVSKIRNSVIARIFRELDLIEQWGSGVRRIFKEAEEQNLPEPQIVEIGMRIRFIVPMAEPLPLKSPPKPSRHKPGVESGVESGGESDMAMRIIALLEKEPLAKSEIAIRLGKAKPSRYLNDLMRKLLQADRVEYTIPDKPNSRLQKYKLAKKQEGKAQS